MKRTILALMLAALALGACRNEPAADAEALSPYEVYGAALTDDGAVPVQAVVAEPDQYLDRVVKIEGTVAEVCQMAGCWLTLRTDDDLGVRVHVARTDDGDYVFTVPKDLSGRRVVVQGTLTQETLSEEHQRHLAEDAGHDADAQALPPLPELQLTAQGVLVEKTET